MFLNCWQTLEDMKADFWPGGSSEDYQGELEGATILLASYDTGGYEGNAFVLFTRDGKLYEVHGSHCSCFGLEGQWEPEETTVGALRYRLDNGELGKNEFDSELRTMLAQAVIAN